MTSMETDTCVEALISSWIARFSIPAIINSDRGSQFTSSILAATCQQLGVKHVTTTAYHPQSNGMVERVHRHLKEGLKARGAQADWPQHLPWVLLNIRTAPKTDSNTSAAKMVYGVALTLPAQLPLPNETTPAAVERQREEAPIPTRVLPHPPPTEVPAHLATAEMVYVRKVGHPGLLTPPYSSLYRVISRGPKYLSIDIRGTAAGGHSGPPQTAHRDVSVDTSCPATQGAAATADNAPQPAQEGTFPGPASNNRRPAGAREAPASEIRPLSDKQSRGSSVVPPIDQSPPSL